MLRHVAIPALLLSVSVGLRVPPHSKSTVTRHALALSCATLLTCGATVPSLAASPSQLACSADCFRECEVIAPGNGGYCASQCESHCPSLGPDGYDPEKRSEKTPTSQAELPSDVPRVTAQNNGIFGDSGISYSKGTEDLFATVFGAKRQSKDLDKADVGSFASEVGEAARVAILGGERANP